MTTLTTKNDLKNVLNEIETLATTPSFIAEAVKLVPKYGFTAKEWNTNKAYILYLLASKIVLNN